jgi:hypothetical protein
MTEGSGSVPLSQKIYGFGSPTLLEPIKKLTTTGVQVWCSQNMFLHLIFSERRHSQVPVPTAFNKFSIMDFFVLHSTPLHMPLLRIHCVRGCWDRTQYSCDFGTGSNNSARSHPGRASICPVVVLRSWEPPVLPITINMLNI